MLPLMLQRLTQKLALCLRSSWDPLPLPPLPSHKLALCLRSSSDPLPLPPLLPQKRAL